MAAEWFRCSGGIWCDLFKLNLDHPIFSAMEGVFMLWVGEGDKIKVLLVGHGKIKERLEKIKKELSIQAFSHLGVKVSWAEVSAVKRTGVEMYLIHHLKPTMNFTVPKGIPIKINLPWEDSDYDEEEDEE